MPDELLSLLESQASLAKANGKRLATIASKSGADGDKWRHEADVWFQYAKDCEEAMKIRRNEIGGKL